MPSSEHPKFGSQIELWSRAALPYFRRDGRLKLCLFYPAILDTGVAAPESHSCPRKYGMGGSGWWPSYLSRKNWEHLVKWVCFAEKEDEDEISREIKFWNISWKRFIIRSKILLICRNHTKQPPVQLGTRHKTWQCSAVSCKLCLIVASTP